MTPPATTIDEPTKSVVERALRTIDAADYDDGATIAWVDGPADEISVETASLPVVDLGLATRSRATPADFAAFSTLGEGGFGRVIEARQRSIDRLVAIKTLRADAPPKAAHRLHHEARLTGSLEHPGIVPVHMYGADAEGRPAFVMKRVDGETWSALRRAPHHTHWRSIAGRDALERDLRILGAICQALAYAHDRGILHRDIKPDNVMVGPYGDVYLMDWGVGIRLDGREGVLERQVVGTPAYMAPEMIALGPITRSTDIYLLGATLYELLAGAPPHSGGALRDILVRVCAKPTPPLPPSTPAELAALCHAAMDSDPRARPPSPAAFKRSLDAFLEHRDAGVLAAAAKTQLDAIEARYRASASVRSDRRRLGELRAALDQPAALIEQAEGRWPDGPFVRGVADQLASLRAELGVALRDAVGARTAWEAMSADAQQRSDVLPSIEALEAHEAALLARLDGALGGPARLAVVLGVCTAGFAITVWDVIGAARGSLSTLRLLEVAAAMTASLAATAIGAWPWARDAWRTRRLLGIAFAMTLGLLVHRAIATALDLAPSDVLARDAFLLGGMYALSGVLHARWFWICAGVFLIPAAAVFWAPAWLGVLFSPAVFATTVIAAAATYRELRAANSPLQ